MLNLTKFFASIILLGFATVLFAMTFQPADLRPTLDAGVATVPTDLDVSLIKNKQVAPSPVALMSSTVRIHVVVEQTRLATEKTPESPEKEEWSGSGVVYEKTDGKKGPIRSRILSANHVLETPAVGSVKDDILEFLGMQINTGKVRTDSVKIELQTADGRICNVQVLALGSSDTRDVATAEADCDAGRVAELANEVPTMGAKVFVAGYSHGVKLPMLTEGFVSGWMDGYLLTSAAAVSGNSGGPVFHNGKVIGLLVRADRSYPHLSFAVTLEECMARIAQTPSL